MTWFIDSTVVAIGTDYPMSIMGDDHLFHITVLERIGDKFAFFQHTRCKLYNITHSAKISFSLNCVKVFD